MRFRPHNPGRFNSWISEKLIGSGKNSRYLRYILLGLIIVPVIVTSIFSYRTANHTLTKLTQGQRRATANLVATAIEQRFTDLTDLGVSLATRVQFQQLVSEGKWQEAIVTIKDIPGRVSFVDQIFLSDPAGNTMALTGPDQSTIGKNFAYRDWYQGLTKNWQPYVSNVYQRANEPKYNVIAVAVPIISDQHTKLGILVMQVQLKTMLGWTTKIEEGPSGFIYIVDPKANIAVPPLYPSQAKIVNFSSEPAVQKVLRGQSGAEVTNNSIDHQTQLAAYSPVPGYGWGSVVTEPASIAFAERDEALRQSLIFSSFLVVVTILLAYLFSTAIKVLNGYRQKEKVLLQSIGDGLAVIDRDFRVTLWNKVTRELTGWSSSEALGRHLKEVMRFVRESDGQPHFEFIEEAMTSGKIHTMENHTLLIRKDGSKISVNNSAAPVFNQKGAVTGVIIVIRDVTKEVEFERSRDEFFSIASHELRTPLTAIRGNSSLIKQHYADELKDPNLREMIEDIHESSSRLIEIVNDFLDTSRLEQKRMKFQFEAFDVVVMAESVIRENQVTSPRHKVALEVKKPSSGSLMVYADQNRTKQVLINLVGNALKFTEQGSVTISFSGGNGFVKILVADTGKGMSAEVQHLLFRKFEQIGGDVFTRDSVRGTGLGLYISKMVTEQMHGHIQLEASTLGTGTTFSFTLPIATLEQQSAGKPTPIAGQPSTTGPIFTHQPPTV